jgi:hypothetical protein
MIDAVMLVLRRVGDLPDSLQGNGGGRCLPHLQGGRHPTSGGRVAHPTSCEWNQQSSPVSSFGSVLAICRGNTYEALPVGFMLDGLYSALEAFSAFALEEHEPGSVGM